MKLPPLLFFQLPALLPVYLTQKEISCCGPLHSKKNKKECLNEKYKPCQHKSTNTQNAKSFLHHPAAHGNSTKGTKKPQNLPNTQRTNSQRIVIKVKNEKIPHGKNNFPKLLPGRVWSIFPWVQALLTFLEKEQRPHWDFSSLSWSAEAWVAAQVLKMEKEPWIILKPHVTEIRPNSLSFLLCFMTSVSKQPDININNTGIMSFNCFPFLYLPFDKKWGSSYFFSLELVDRILVPYVWWAVNLRQKASRIQILSDCV